MCTGNTPLFTMLYEYSSVEVNKKKIEISLSFSAKWRMLVSTANVKN